MLKLNKQKKIIIGLILFIILLIILFIIKKNYNAHHDDPTTKNVSYYGIYSNGGDIAKTFNLPEKGAATYTGQFYIYPTDESTVPITGSMGGKIPLNVTDYLKAGYTKDYCPSYYLSNDPKINNKYFRLTLATDNSGNTAQWPLPSIPPYVENGKSLALVLKDSLTFSKNFKPI